MLVNQLTELRIMSKAWAEKNKVGGAQDIERPRTKTFAHRNALGTGPYQLKQWTPDQRVVLEPNPHWWGKGQVPHQPDRDRLHPIKADATRTAALLG